MCEGLCHSTCLTVTSSLESLSFKFSHFLSSLPWVSFLNFQCYVQLWDSKILFSYFPFWTVDIPNKFIKACTYQSYFLLLSSKKVEFVIRYLCRFSVMSENFVDKTVLRINISTVHFWVLYSVVFCSSLNAILACKRLFDQFYNLAKVPY